MEHILELPVIEYHDVSQELAKRHQKKMLYSLSKEMTYALTQQEVAENDIRSTEESTEAVR